MSESIQKATEAAGIVASSLRECLSLASPLKFLILYPLIEQAAKLERNLIAFQEAAKHG
jgi:hypothetical protein